MVSICQGGIEFLFGSTLVRSYYKKKAGYGIRLENANNLSSIYVIGGVYNLN